MKITPDQKAVNVSRSDADLINEMHQKLRESGVRVKKYELWGEAVRLLKVKLLNSNGGLKK